MSPVIIAVLIVIVLMSGCDEADQEVPPYIPKFMYSDVEGKYYITLLGGAEQSSMEFQRIFDQNVEIITGYYENRTPSDKELKRLQIERLPVYLIFDTEKEVLRTGDLNELALFLSSRSTNKDQNN